MKKRLLPVLLTVCLVFSLFTGATLAAEPVTTEDALNNAILADDSRTITISGTITLTKDLTIPSDKTVVLEGIDESSKILASGQNTILVQGNLTINNLIVEGEMERGYAPITVAANNAELHSDGLNLINTQTSGTDGFATSAQGIQIASVKAQFDNAPNSVKIDLKNSSIALNAASARGISFGQGTSQTSTVVLDNTIIRNGTKWDTQWLGGYSRGLNITSDTVATVEVKNASKISGWQYAINEPSKDEAGKGANIIIDGSELLGWSAFNIWSDNATITITNNSKIIGTNGQFNSDKTYTFSSIVLNGNIYSSPDTYNATGNKLILEDSTVIAETVEEMTPVQSLIRIDCNENTVEFKGTVTLQDTTNGSSGAVFQISNMENPMAFVEQHKNIADQATVNLPSGNSLLPTLNVYYYRISDGKEEGLYCDINDVLASKAGLALCDGEFIRLENDAVLNENVTVNLQEGTGSFTLTQGDCDIIRTDNAQILLPAGVSVNTDKEADSLFSAAEGCTLNKSSSNGTFTYSSLADENIIALVAGVYYTDLTAAIDAAEAGETVTLLKDAVDQNTIQITDGKEVTLDLNGYNIGFAEKNSFRVRHGELNLTGSGKVHEEKEKAYFSPVIMYGSPDEDIANYSVVTVGKDVTLEGWAGLFLDQNSGKNNYGMVATVDGTLISVKDSNGDVGSGLYLNGTVKHTDGNVPKITVNPGAVITASGTGMYLAGYADTTINGATISGGKDGGTGIEIRAGKLDITESSVTGGSGEIKVDSNGNGTTTKNAAVAVSQHTTKLPLNVTIHSGTFTGTCALGQITPETDDPADLEKIDVTVAGGKFNGVVCAEDTKNFISGGNFTSDPKAFLAEGYTVVASTEAGYAYQVVEKIQTAVPVEPHVADSSAPEPGKLVEALDLTQEQAQAVSDAAKSVKAPDLAAAAGSEANSITKEEAKALVDQANITPAEGEKVTLYVQTFLDVQPKEYDPQTGVLKLEITPKYQIVASTAKTAEGILPNNSQTVQDPLPTEVSTTVTMSLKLPAEFVSGAAPSPAPSAAPSPAPIYVQHSKDGVTYVYDTVLDEATKTITFENPHGFSTFVVTKAAPVAKIGDIGYTSLQDAVDKVKDNETIVLQNNNAENVLVSQAVVFTLKENGKTFTGSISAAPGYKLEKKENVYTVIRLADEEGTVTQTYAITVEASNGGTVTSNFNKASKNQTITLTAVAEEGYELKTLTVTDEDGNEIALTEKGEGKYTFTMPGSKVTGKATFATVTEESPFADVKADDWFYDAVMYVYDKGMMNGDAGMFSPNNNLTRGMIAQVLYNLEGKPEVTESAFTDVAENAWYADAVNWAAKQGIVSGYGNGLFGPEDDITREQMALILYKYAEVKGYDITLKGDLTAFTDGEETSDWAKEAVEWAVGAKLISGKGNGQLDPTGTAIRAEVAQILMSFCENIVK